MKFKLTLLCSLLMGVLHLQAATTSAPLRVFIRGGEKTHGPGQHDHPRFLQEWKTLLNDRGAKTDGGMEFPSADQLKETDVLILYAANAGTLSPAQKTSLETFLQRGGGLVVLHDAVVGNDPEWYKTIIGGAWENGKAKWLEGKMSLYFTEGQHPITREASNFDFVDEIYYDLNMMPEVQVLAAAYTPKITNKDRAAKAQAAGQVNKIPTVYDIQPQMWTYEKANHRAFVSIPGHEHKNFERPNYRAILLRGIAWAGKRDNVNELCREEELASLRYPEGGPTAPEKAAEKIVLHPDFTLSLVVAEPLINKPMALDWDPQGRLWVAETPEYPNGRRLGPGAPPSLQWRQKNPGQPWPTKGVEDRPALDRISYLVDTDGDGRMDKKEIFYEGLELVTAFVFHKDGVIVSQAPDILWLRDTNHDGKADKVEKLYTGLGTGDTHAVINNLRWGVDGWIYATHGYSSGNVKSPDGSKDFGNIGSGVIRFKPDGSAFEQYSSKGGNTWGLDLSWDNEVFFTQPTSGDLLNHVVLPEHRLVRGKAEGTTSFKPLIRGRNSYPLLNYEQQAYVQIDQVGKFTASAGCAIYDGGAWPKDYNYSYFTTEPTINIIHHEVVEPDGVSFQAHKVREPEFIGSRDLWFRPIETRIGPDGALYIIDFYNQAVIHNDTRGPVHGPANAAVRPDRDHYFGRIWRVDHKQAQKLPPIKLAQAKPADLVKALEHPNRPVRMEALRLLSESSEAATAPALRQLVASAKTPETRVSALWTLYRIGQLDDSTLTAAFNSDNAAVRKNAAETASLVATQVPSAQKELVKRLGDTNARVRMEAIAALGNYKLETQSVNALVAVYPTLETSWDQSALLGVLGQDPLSAIKAAFASSNAGAQTKLVSSLTTRFSLKAEAQGVSDLVQFLAQAPAATDSLKVAVLQNLARGLKADLAPAWSNGLQQALQTLITSQNPQVAGTTLPLAARWDKTGALSRQIKAQVQQLIARLKTSGVNDEELSQISVNLLGLRSQSPEILPAVIGLLNSSASEALKTQILQTLGNSADPAVGAPLAAAYAGFNDRLQAITFNLVLKRADWSMALLDLVEAKKLDVTKLGPANISRLRQHPNLAVSNRATQIINDLRGPEAKEKNELIATLSTVVTQPGNVAKGREVFTQNCATCHKLDALGSEVGPILTGMGAHGPAELLVHILDPNREVDPSFSAWNIETRDGESYDGIIVRENRASVVLKNTGGEKEIARDTIKSQRNTGRSLMPEGFESLGGETLRDLLAFMCSSENQFRYLDLSQVFTADSRRGLFISAENLNETVKFASFGSPKVAGIPFHLVDPTKSVKGKNLVVLKGGPNQSVFSQEFPLKVQARVGYGVKKLHFLGGVSGWGFPAGGEDLAGQPILKVTLQYAGGNTEEKILKNGVEFADYNRVISVPGSQLAEGLVTTGQLRWFSVTPSQDGVIENVTLESLGNQFAPVTAAITAELAGAGAAGSTPALRPVSWGKGIRTVVAGGGSSHDFGRWFNKADTALLESNRLASVYYTENPDEALAALAGADVLYLNTNKREFSNPAFRAAVMDFVKAGKGLVLVHPGLWYNWNDWPEYNRVLVGGGTRRHDNFGPFPVTVTNPAHPVMAGVPDSFEITDELYNFIPDSQGTPIEVLASAKSPKTGDVYHQVWIVKHPQARIVCITLGHDGKAHDHPAYQAILINSLKWAARK